MSKVNDRKHLSLRIDAELLEKFKQVCEYEGRSANGQLLVYIRSAVKEYERANGPMQTSPEDARRV